jgi:hypothetical protein
MTQEHPITPPPNLIEQWMQDHSTKYALARKAAQWGADQELEACCADLRMVLGPDQADWLRSVRRPKPPSLKEQALGALYAIATGADDTREFHQDLETIKSALEQLDD